VVKERLKHPVIIDGRNLYEPEMVEAHSIAYYGGGRGRSVLA
jgi:UDPglucose 6-dehydrogenase